MKYIVAKIDNEWVYVGNRWNVAHKALCFLVTEGRVRWFRVREIHVDFCHENSPLLDRRTVPAVYRPND